MKPVVAAILNSDRETERSDVFRALKGWRDFDLDVYASDGGNYKGFRSELRGLSIVIFDRPQSGVGYGMKQTIEEAANNGAPVIYTEGDKGGEYGFHLQSESFLSLMEESDVVIVGRDKRVV